MNGSYYPLVSFPNKFELYDDSHKEAVIDGEGIASQQFGEMLYHDWDVSTGVTLYGNETISPSLNSLLSSDSYVRYYTVGSLCFVEYSILAETLCNWTTVWTGLPKPLNDVCDYRTFGNTYGLNYVRIKRVNLLSYGEFEVYLKTEKKRAKGMLVYPYETDASGYKNEIYRYKYDLDVQYGTQISSQSTYESYESALEAAKGQCQAPYYYGILEVKRLYSEQSGTLMRISVYCHMYYHDASASEDEYVNDAYEYDAQTSIDYFDMDYVTSHARSGLWRQSKQDALNRSVGEYAVCTVVSTTSQSSRTYSYAVDPFTVFVNSGSSTISQILTPPSDS